MDNSIHFSKEDANHLVNKLNTLKCSISDIEYKRPQYSVIRDQLGYYHVKVVKFFKDGRDNIFYL